MVGFGCSVCEKPGTCTNVQHAYCMMMAVARDTAVQLYNYIKSRFAKKNLLESQVVTGIIGCVDLSGDTVDVKHTVLPFPARCTPFDAQRVPLRIDIGC